MLRLAAKVILTKDKLTKSQEEAVAHFKGPALVIAGPGAGKTFVITERVKNLILKHKVDPKKILVTTFTDKAAAELKVKLARVVGKDAERMHISTIHSFCKSMLEKYFLHHDLGADIDILDSESQLLLIDINKAKLGLAYWKDKKLIDLKSRYNYVKDVSTLYDLMTQNQITPAKLIESLKNAGDLDEESEIIINSYSDYLGLLGKEHKLDFTSLQTEFFKLLDNKEEVLKDIQDAFEFILVDEYQDTSPVQDKIFRLIAGKNKNIFVVGDENQSIYGFRGASLKNFRKFAERFPTSKEYFLNTNFRSTKELVNFSNNIFKTSLRKELEAKRRKGEKIKLIHDSDSDGTAKQTVEFLKKLKEKGIIKKYGDIALLFRSLKGHSPEFLKYLSKEDIPYVTFGDGKFIERDEIRTMIYLMSYVTQELYMNNRFKKWDHWWRKDMFMSDFFSFSKKTNELIAEGGFNLCELRDVEDFNNVGFTNPGDIEKIRKLNRLKFEVEQEKNSFGDLQKGKNSLLKIFYKILDYSGYFTKIMFMPDTSKKRELLQNLGRLSEIIGRYLDISKKEDVTSFLWYIYGISDNIDQCKLEDENTVKLLTVHKAKGLEFPVVVLCCLNEGRFPLSFKNRNMINIPNELMDREFVEDDEEGHYDEEKRLFYVGVTRAQDILIFTNSDKHKSRSWKTSRFMEVVTDDLLTNDFSLPAEAEYKLARNIPNLNYSAINTFIDCPLRYDLIYNYRFVTPASYMQRMGTFIHNSLQKIHEAIKKKHEISPDEMKELVETYWLDLPTSPKINENLKKTRVKKLVNYYITAKDLYSDVLAIEESFSHIDENMIINGKVDLIAKDKDGKVCLIDFKARTKEGIEKTNVDKQLQIYDYCLDEYYKIDELMAYTFEDNAQTLFEPENKKTETFLLDMSKKMSVEDFQKQKNDFCPQCQFKFYCWGE